MYFAEAAETGSGNKGMLEIKDLSFSYGSHKVLDRVSVSAGPGECLGILGANGCGKSTFLAAVSGAIKPRSGTILYQGEDLRGNKRKQWETIGYVPQESPLFPELTVKDNLRLWQMEAGAGNEEKQKELLCLLGIEGVMNQQVRKLSGGMKKRAGIACAMVKEPPVLVLDEPSAALDLICKKSVHDYLALYLARGGTVLITTHEESELDLCTGMYRIKDGLLTGMDRELRGAALAEFLR